MSSWYIILSRLFAITLTVKFEFAWKVDVNTVITRYLFSPASTVVHPMILYIIQNRVKINELYLLVAHVPGVIVVSGGLSLITHAAKLGATGPIVSTRPLVALALASDKNDLFSTKGEYFIFCLLWLCTEVSSGVSELQVGTIITNPTKIIFAFLVCHILTLRGDLLFPTLAIVVSKQGFTLCAQMIKTLQHAYSLQSRPFGLKFGPGDLREHLPFGHAAVSWAKNLIDLKLLFLFIFVCESLIIIHLLSMTCLHPQHRPQ